MRARRFAQLIRPHSMFGLSVEDERTLLWYCLGLIAEGGGGDVVMQQKALGNSRSFKASLDHLTVNEWLDSRPEGARPRGNWRIRLGPAAKAERLRYGRSSPRREARNERENFKRGPSRGTNMQRFEKRPQRAGRAC